MSDLMLAVGVGLTMQSSVESVTSGIVARIGRIDNGLDRLRRQRGAAQEFVRLNKELERTRQCARAALVGGGSHTGKPARRVADPTRRLEEQRGLSPRELAGETRKMPVSGPGGGRLQ